MLNDGNAMTKKRLLTTSFITIFHTNPILKERLCRGLAVCPPKYHSSNRNGQKTFIILLKKYERNGLPNSLEGLKAKV